MNEQPLQDYYQLIESLLNCPNGEEPEILAANTELLDAGFLQVLAAVADDFAQQGEENTANRLRNLATYLTSETTPITEEDIETYAQFLLEILQATEHSNGDAQVIYPLLAANTDKLNDIFAELLRRLATNTLAEADRAEYIAGVIGNFSNLIQQFPLGSKANNMEIAITGYEIALTVYTRSAFPVNWAMTQNNLGNAYRNRILGERAENIELAIAAFNQALEVTTKSAFPVNWAMTQNNLGIAYRNRILGERAENIELAIAAFNQALEVRTLSAFPVNWAMTQNNLGIAYGDRILGERAENIELAIAAFNQALEVTTKSAFPVDWAMTQNNLGIAYGDRILGERAENIELAIAAYNQALEVTTKSAFPVDWAMTQNNLGIAYGDRILGERAENIELAIAAFNQALEVTTKSAFPVDWAMTQNNLGEAYRNRILGERAENIELAIAAYNQALEVTTKSAFPVNWATTQNNLGIAYADRILGERAENIESAIAAYSAALSVYTQTAFPKNWAITQNNLGNAYSKRILGEAAENIESAIAALRAALEVRTRSAFPFDWAMTQNNLGNVYSDRILGDRAENIESAIAACSAALSVYTRSAFPFDWAMTQNNLGNAYSDRILGDRAENIESAIAAYSAALLVSTRSGFPENWAGTQNNLGIAYADRILGERAENIESAIAAYNQALEVRTKSAFPVDWAGTENNLGNAYCNRILGERAENIESAIAAFNQALEVRTKSAFPQYHAETLLNLGRLYQDENQFDSAYNTFVAAIETVEALRLEIASGEEARRKQAEEWNQLYRRMVEVCLALAKDTEAIEYIERSKTRNLVELLTKATSANQENLPLVASSIHFGEIQNLLDNETAIIQWYIFTDCFRAFIITHNKLLIWQSKQQDLENLENWINNYLQLYGSDKPKWRSQLSDLLIQLTKILHLNQITSLVPSDCQKLILIPHRYLHLLSFHAIPLSANDSSTAEYLFDRFPGGVSYAPSCQLLRFTQFKAKKLDDLQLNQQSHLFAIQNPTNDLDFTDIEVETIAAGFQPHQILKHYRATKTGLTAQPTNQNLANSQWLHFSCHGYFNFGLPLKSGLQLADAVIAEIPAYSNSSRYLRVDDEKIIDLDKCLTLEDIFQFDLNNCRLVCLSACETGFIDFKNYSDEYIGLASGFIRAGAANIISSLWAVSDFHTALLMIKFYELLPNYQYNMPLALNHTQQWLRQANQTQIIYWLQGLDKMELVKKQQIIDYLDKQYKPEQQPFKKPEFWAAFCAISPVLGNGRQ